MGETPLRRVSAAGAAIDLSAREVIGPDGRRRLEPRAAAVLAALVEAGGAVVGRDALLDGCWRDGEGSDEALTQAVAQIRRALGDDPRRPRFVGTVHRTGYRWLGREPAPEAAAVPAPSPQAPPRRMDWRWAAALSGVAVLGAAATLAFARPAPEPRMEVETEDVVDSGEGPTKTVAYYYGSEAEVRAAMKKREGR